MIEAGLPPGILNVVNGDKEAVDAILDDPDIKASASVGSSPIAQYIYARRATGKRASASAAPRTTPSSCPTPTWTRPSMR